MSRNVQSGAFTEPVSAAREGPGSASCDVRAGHQELDVDHCHVSSPPTGRGRPAVHENGGFFRSVEPREPYFLSSRLLKKSTEKSLVFVCFA
jgi:hypothetical protein